MPEPKQIDEIIAEIMSEMIAKNTYPDADSFTTSVERKLSVNNEGKIEHILYTKTIVQKKVEQITIDITILPSSQQEI